MRKTALAIILLPLLTGCLESELKDLETASRKAFQCQSNQSDELCQSLIKRRDIAKFRAIQKGIALERVAASIKVGYEGYAYVFLDTQFKTISVMYRR